MHGMAFWLGLFLGNMSGLFLAGLLCAAGRADDAAERLIRHKE